jgi:signal transduction histidine kinase/HAMP domain-containing protein
MRFNLTSWALAIILTLALMPLVFTQIVSTITIRDISTSSSANAVEMGDLVAQDTSAALRQLGERHIKRIATDVAKQLEVYIRAHPDMTVADLQKDPYFSTLSVQPVGTTGYTAITDVDTLTNRFHSQPNIVNMDLSTLAEQLPGFWRIMSSTLGGVDQEGYYDWQDPDGSVRAKYMYIATVDARTADNVQFSVAATTYIDEFSMLAEQVSKNVLESVEKSNENTRRLMVGSRALLLNMFIVSLIVIVVVAIMFTKAITNPIIEMTNASEEIAKGKLDVRVHPHAHHEIGQLATSFNTMARELKKSRAQLHRYSDELEKKVRTRTALLNTKVKELSESRTATLNILDDVDAANQELKDTEKKLQDYVRELKLTDTKKDEFISIAAHELKTPLTSIRGFIQLLTVTSITAEQRAHYIQIVITESKRLERLITDILDLSRLDLHALKLNFEKVHIKEVFNELIESYKFQAAQLNLTVSHDLKEDIVISTDKGRLVQVISNLFNNALKFTEKGGVRLHASVNAASLRIDVTDTGVGIPRGKLKEVFERFYQVDSSYTRNKPGTGLGLAICKGIIESMGGHISVQSATGKGTTFSVVLPLEPNLEVLYRQSHANVIESLKTRGYAPAVQVTEYMLIKEGILTKEGMIDETSIADLVKLGLLEPLKGKKGRKQEMSSGKREGKKQGAQDKEAAKSAGEKKKQKN